MDVFEGPIIFHLQVDQNVVKQFVEYLRNDGIYGGIYGVLVFSEEVEHGN